MRFPTSRLCAALFAVMALVPPAHAQGDLSLYGFFQGRGLYSTEDWSQMTAAGPSERTDDTFNFSVQQLNLFFANQFSPSLSAFVNAEIRNTLSTGDGFGELRLEEAWARYHHSSKFNLKVGRLIPTFNNLNEIKNRTPLLPYVSRPLIYESSFTRVLPIDQFVPDQGFIQANGTVPAGPVRLDYAAYVGNGDQTNSAIAVDGTVSAGQDTTMAKLVGGRIGARWRGIKAGLSGTYDEPEHAAFSVGGVALPGPGLGTTPRTRLGADASFTVGRVFGEAEAVQVSYDLDEQQQATLGVVSAATQGVITDSRDARFYYGLLGANVTDKLYAYGRYQFYADESSTTLSEGMDLYGGGGGYRPIDAITVKVEYNHIATRDNPVFGLDADYLFGAVSVSF